MSDRSWRRQGGALLRLTAGRALLGRRAWPVLLLAAMPVVLALLRAVLPPGSERAAVTTSTTEFADVFHFFILRFVVFIVAAVVFTNLFRGEVLGRSLHYTLLAPVRREVVVAGKYLGGLLATVVVLAPSTGVTFLLYYVPHRRLGLEALLAAGLAGQLAGWLAVVVAACAAYGALFTLAGLLFRNPMLPALILLGWEALTPFLPSALKALSVNHYLLGLTPVPPSVRAFTLLARPPSVWVATAGLLVVAGLALTASVWRARRLEITYGAD